MLLFKPDWNNIAADSQIQNRPQAHFANPKIGLELIGLQLKPVEPVWLFVQDRRLLDCWFE